jgi:hypothetical protein
MNRKEVQPVPEQRERIADLWGRIVPIEGRRKGRNRSGRHDIVARLGPANPAAQPLDVHWRGLLPFLLFGACPGEYSCQAVIAFVARNLVHLSVCLSQGIFQSPRR